MWQALIDFLTRLKFYVVIDPEERGVLVRAGRIKDELSPGWHWLLPIVDEVTACNVQEQVIDTPNQLLMTCDGKALGVSATLRYRIDDLGLAAFTVADFDEALLNSAMAKLSAAVNSRTLVECASSFGIEDDVLKSITETAQHWGLEVTNFELTSKCPVRPIMLMNIAE